MTPAAGAWPLADLGHAPLSGHVTDRACEAVVAIRQAFQPLGVRAWPDGSGGAFVIVESLDLGPTWATRVSWLGFNISYLHPDADCYPHYLRPDLARADGKALATPPFNPGNQFAGVPAVMISRRSPNRNPSLDTPARKAQSVVTFIRGQL